MSRHIYIILLGLLTGLPLIVPAQKAMPLTNRELTIRFHHIAGNSALVFGDTVQTGPGEKITIEKFRYYVSSFSVKDENGKTYRLPAAYYLVDENEPASKTIVMKVPAEKITAIRFLLGVDSIRNVSGIQTGALDPLKGMFWTWNSGYIMAKLEGTCEGLAAAGQRFTYHIGGFRTGMNTLHEIEITIPSPRSVSVGLDINADILKWFSGKQDIRIKETPVCHSPGKLAVAIADNYSQMFSLKEVQQ